MLRQLEDAPVPGRGGIEDRVAAEEAHVEDGDLRLVPGHVLAVDVDDQRLLAHRALLPGRGGQRLTAGGVVQARAARSSARCRSVAAASIVSVAGSMTTP